MCNTLNATDGIHIGYKKVNSVWKKYDGSEVLNQFDFDWIPLAYNGVPCGSIGDRMSLECFRGVPEYFGKIFDLSHNKFFICQYV